jgi:uncharacterized protein (DUF4415 family)
MIAETFGPTAAEGLRRGRGRPEKPDRKVNQTLRLDPDGLEAYRREGSGWQTRMNEVLRDHMPRSALSMPHASDAKPAGSASRRQRNG